MKYFEFKIFENPPKQEFSFKIFTFFFLKNLFVSPDNKFYKNEYKYLEGSNFRNILNLIIAYWWVICILTIYVFNIFSMI